HAPQRNKIVQRRAEERAKAHHLVDFLERESGDLSGENLADDRSRHNDCAGDHQITANNDGVQHLQPSFYATLLCLKVGEPAQGSHSGHEAICTARCDDKPREALKAFANRPPWNCKAAAPFVRPGDGILIAARPKEYTVIYPLRLDELELPAEVSADKREHQPS